MCDSGVSPFTKADFLKAEGIYLRNQSGVGERILLRGTNLGGWLHREGWMDGGGMIKELADSSQWILVDSLPTGDHAAILRTLTDGDPDTRWTTNAPQEPMKAYLTLDLGHSQRLNHIQLDVGSSEGDYPAAYRIEVSPDGERWDTAAEGKGRREKILDVEFPTVCARFIKITQTGSRPNAYWSVAGICIMYQQFYDDYTGRRLLRQRFGDEKAEELLDIYRNSYIQEQDLDFLQAMGFNFLRLPIYWQELLKEDGTWRPDAFKHIDWLVEACGRRRIYVMLDLHGSPGGHSAGWLTGGQTGGNQLWSRSDYQEWDEKIWRTIATHYKGNPTVAGYDLLNEPVPPENSSLTTSAFYDRLYRSVRCEDPDHIISFGAFFDFDVLGDPREYGWENILYQTHHYGDNDGTGIRFAMDTLRHLKDYQAKWKIPLLVGEFNCWGFMDIWDAWLTGLEESWISWSSWTFKNIDSHMCNSWGYFYHNDVIPPDYERDDEKTLCEKMAAFHTGNYRPNEALIRTVKRHTLPVSHTALPEDVMDRRGFIATASHFPQDARYVLDGDSRTAWCTHERMCSGQWIQVDMGENRTVTGVLLDVGEGETAFPRKFHVQVSDNGSLWEYASLCEWKEGIIGRWEIRFAPQNTRYIRLSQTAAFRVIPGGIPFDETLRWAIRELYIMGDELNRPPVFRPMKDVKATAGQELRLTLKAVDADGDPLVYSCDNLPVGATLDAASGKLCWLPREEDGGDHTLCFRVTDGKAWDELQLPVSVGCRPCFPLFLAEEVFAGSILQVDLSARGIQSYRCENLPMGCRLDETTGVLTWAPRAEQVGEWQLLLLGEGEYGMDRRTMTVRVCPAPAATAQVYYTSQDMKNCLTRQKDIPLRAPQPAVGTLLRADQVHLLQSFEGFGSSFDGSTLYNLTHQPPDSRRKLMRALFHPTQGANWNFMRICFGASDFAADSFYTYDDMPDGETDFELNHFSIEKDVERGIISYILEARRMNPAMRILASVWSPPAWMKKNGSLLMGGSLREDCYQALASYYVRAVEAYEAAGIPIYAVTLQNEPDVVQPYPTTAFTGEEQKRLLLAVKKAFTQKGLATEVWVMDTNFLSCAEYGEKLLSDPETRSLVDGVAFHDYAGEPETMAALRERYPGVGMHITERSTYNIEGADRLLQYFRQGAETYNAWLIFLDEKGEPAMGPLDGSNPPQPVRSPHGKPEQWYLTVDYYFYSQISRFVQRGARVAVSDYGSRDTVTNVVFVNPDGSWVIYVVNQTDESQSFSFQLGGQQLDDRLPARTAGTYICGNM